VMRDDQRACLLRALSARERLILTLRFEEELSWAEIGEAAGFTASSVQGTCESALRRLRARAVRSAALENRRTAGEYAIR